MKKWTLVSIVLLCLWNLILSWLFLRSPNEIELKQEIKTTNGTTLEKTDITNIVSQNLSSVVQVHATISDNTKISSGFVIQQKEELLQIVTVATNLEESAKIRVVFDSGASVDAAVLAKDEVSKVALLSVKVPFRVTPLSLANETNYQIGKAVINLGARRLNSGAPLVSTGHLSGLAQLNQQVKGDWKSNMIQSDAISQKEMFGGPVLDFSGKVLGMLMEAPFGQNNQFSYALSSFELEEVIHQLGQSPGVNRGSLGVSVRDISDLLSYEKSFRNIKLDTTKGVLVLSKSEFSSLNVGDLITKIDQTEIKNLRDFLMVSYLHKPKDVVNVTVVREGKEVIQSVEMR